MLRKFNSQNKNWHYGKAQRILKEHIFYLFFFNLEHFFVKQKERFKYSIYYRLKNAHNKPIWLEIKYNLKKKKKKDTHKNKFSSYTPVSIAIFNCNPHCNYNNYSDNNN